MLVKAIHNALAKVVIIHSEAAANGSEVRFFSKQLTQQPTFSAGCIGKGKTWRDVQLVHAPQASFAVSAPCRTERYSGVISDAVEHVLPAAIEPVVQADRRPHLLSVPLVGHLGQGMAQAKSQRQVWLYLPAILEIVLKLVARVMARNPTWRERIQTISRNLIIEKLYGVGNETRDIRDCAVICRL